MEHTPGPWECIGGEFHKDPEMEGLVSYFVKLPGGPLISKANADLIAAAPEMYATLLEIRAWMDAEVMGAWDAKFIAEIDAVLAKARGRAPAPPESTNG